MTVRIASRFALASFCSWAASAATAADYTVMSSADSGAGTLRNLVTAAVDGDRLFFDPSVTSITLTTSNIVIRSAVEIRGEGVMINGNGIDRIFNINAGNTTDLVTFSGLTITNGAVATLGGGGIYVPSALLLTLTNCVVTGCRTTANVSGGGIYSSASLLAVDCRFESNSAGGTSSGGAVFTSTAIPENVTLTRCTFVGNTAVGAGGGSGGGAVFNSAGLIKVEDSTFSNNVATAGWGGGFATTGATASNTVKNCTFVSNRALQGGGIGSRTSCTADGCTFLRNECSAGGGAYAVYSGGVAYLVQALNCLFEGNSATNSASPALGGAFYNREGDGVISNCVFRGNVDRNLAGTGGAGGAVATYSTSGTMKLYSSLFAGNRSYGTGGAVSLQIPSTLVDCTFVTNTCATDGGAIYGGGTNRTTGSYAKEFRNCTFSGNVAGDGTGDNGGAIFLADGDLRVYNSTIVTNFGQGAGIYINAGNSFAYLESTIVAGNIDTVAVGTLNDLQGTFREIDYCLIQESPATYTLVDATPVGNLAAATDPKLGPLANNGGPTLPGGAALLTYALLKGSPALDVGTNRLALTYDQRGVRYPRETPTGKPDIGAFEYTAPPAGGTLIWLR